MSGAFEVSTTGTVLKFPDESKYPGLEVRLDEAPIGLMLDVMEDSGRLAAARTRAERAKVLRSLLGKLAGVLEEWNLTRKGEPVPATLEGLLSLGDDLIGDLLRAWLTGKTTTGDDDLGKGSGSGGSSQEELTAAAALSSSLPSSSQQKF